jgi:hypothetical protein
MRKVLGTGNPSMMRLMLNFGESYENKNDYVNALHIYQECAIVLKNTIGF